MPVLHRRMEVKCKKCGASHPTWDCQASAAKIASYAASKNEPVATATLAGDSSALTGSRSAGSAAEGGQAPRSRPSVPNPKSRPTSSDSVRNAKADEPAAVERPEGERRNGVPHLNDTQISVPSGEHPVIAGAKFIAEVPAGTMLKSFGNKVIASGPGLVPSIVTKDGLVPITSEKDLKPKDERIGNRHRPGYHAERRAKLKAAKEAK